MDDPAEAGRSVPRLRGALLVASPNLGDPNFDRSVILLLEHNDEGALGVVLNRPTAVSVEEVLESWHDQAAMAPPGVLFAGGPVSREAVIGLARVEHETGGSDLGSGVAWKPLIDELGTVDLSVAPEDHPVPLAGARLFSGYAGWDGGQLEEEISQGAWFVVEALTGDLLCTQPRRLWHDVLRRQRGNLSLLASYPPHPSVN
jgi:putative transcriptional regulator